MHVGIDIRLALRPWVLVVHVGQQTVHLELYPEVFKFFVVSLCFIGGHGMPWLLQIPRQKAVQAISTSFLSRFTMQISLCPLPAPCVAQENPGVFPAWFAIRRTSFLALVLLSPNHSILKPPRQCKQCKQDGLHPPTSPTSAGEEHGFICLRGGWCRVQEFMPCPVREG